MAFSLPTIVSYCREFLTSVFSTDTPGAPQVGDTDFMPASAALIALNDLFKLNNGQIPIGKTATAALTNPSVAPVLTNTTTGGSLVPGPYQVGYTYINAYGETLIVTSLGNITIPAGTSTNKINVAAITPLPSGATSVNWYLSKTVGGFSLGFAVNNAGTAFSLTALPLGGAASPPGTNTTAGEAHPVKATLTAGSGITVTNGAGSITIAATGVVGSGTVFPGTPNTGDMFVRTDLANALYFFNGSSWVTVGAGGGGGTTISAGTVFPTSPSFGDLFIRTDFSPLGLNRYNGSTWDLLGDGTGVPPLTSGHIFVGNGSNVPTDVAMGGNVSITNTGITTVIALKGMGISSLAAGAANQFLQSTSGNGTSGTCVWANLPPTTDIKGWPITNTVPTLSGAIMMYSSASGGQIFWGTGQIIFGAAVFNSANIALTSGSSTALSFDSEEFKSATGFHSNVTNPSRITLPTSTAGFYHATANVEFAANATGSRTVSIRKNGTTTVATERVSAAAAGTTCLSVSRSLQLADTDYLEVMVLQDSGGSLNAIFAASEAPTFQVVRVGT
jgi:hypothetical protein